MAIDACQRSGLLLFRDAQDHADGHSNGIRGAPIRVEAEVFHLRPQCEFSAAVEPDLGASAGADSKPVGRVAHSAEEYLGERSESAPVTGGKAGAKRVGPRGQPRSKRGSVIQAEVAGRSEPIVDIQCGRTTAALYAVADAAYYGQED